MATGSVDVDFGAFPGGVEATAVITGQTSLASGSFIEAWLAPEIDTTDHTTYDQLADGVYIACRVSDKVAGTGFTIYLYCIDEQPRFGKYHVNWAWA